MNELTIRVLFAVPAAAIFLWLTWLGGPLFQLFIALLALAALLEMTRIFSKLPYPASVPLSLAVAIYLWTIPWLAGWIALAVAALLVLVTVWALLSGENRPAGRWLATLFCGAYAPLGFWFFYQVRAFEPSADGLWLAFALLLMIWGNDIFAYFGGKTFGKRPLAPTISPKKTWEGFWSGFLGSLAGLLVIYLVADPFPVPFLAAAPMVLLVSTFGPLGDLSASRLKRVSGVKDSSNILPGHGGFLDRFDALLLSSPVIFIYLNWIL